VARQNWTREQSILALYLYCQFPFGQIHSTNKYIAEIAELIGRSPAALTMKMCNFARFDPELQGRGVAGLTNGSRLDEEIWIEFSSDFSLLSYEATAILSNLKKQGVDSFVDLSDLPDIPLGDTRNQIVNARINQTFFRRALLSSFNNTCCITKIQVPELLVASHIKPWSVCNESEKTNPRNGLLLNVFHDKAFDLGYFTINNKFEIIVSLKIETYLNNRFCREWLKSLNGKEIKRPEKFLPSSEFIEYHNDVVFLK
jgi:putative restriction endonuclease